MTDIQDNTATPEPCNRLQSVLLAAEAQILERFAGFALGSLLRVPFRHARSGDQRGGDGGTSGLADRHLVFEARRYNQRTSLDERSIRGQIDQAVERHPDLEAWFLVTTQEVPEQLQDAIDKKARSLGIAAVIVDWAPHHSPDFARSPLILRISSPPNSAKITAQSWRKSPSFQAGIK